MNGNEDHVDRERKCKGTREYIKKGFFVEKKKDKVGVETLMDEKGVAMTPYTDVRTLQKDARTK